MAIRIHSLTTTAGYLEGAPITFAPGLTCIIGSRGTCKSTLVETLRFAFDCDPGRVTKILLAEPSPQAETDALSQRGLVRATLGDGKVCCQVAEDTRSGMVRLTVERDRHAKPRIYREGIKELADTSILDCIEIYSQGDLQQIAEHDQRRLDLIDRPHRAEVAKLIAQRDRLTGELSQLGPELRTRRSEIEARRADLKGLQDLQSQLAQLRTQRPSPTEELDRERAAFLKRKAVLDGLQDAIAARNRCLAALLNGYGSAPVLESLRSAVPDIALPEAADLLAELESFKDLLHRHRGELEREGRKDLDGLLQRVSAACEERSGRYYSLRQEQQAVNESLKREDALKQQIEHLERLQRELEGLLEEERRLVRQRQEHREAVRRINDQIFALRLAEVDQINSRHTQVVLTLEQGSRSPGYADCLAQLLGGSRLRNQADVVRELSEKVRPCDLIDAVEAGDSQRLATALGRDLGQMARLVAFLLDNPRLYDLEGVVFEDRLEITLYDGEVPKPVNQLSKGQKATALLPLILRRAPYPLVFDQPEDDLDNRFIYTTLVENVRRLKAERQLIFVTHNANIPVLGEADAVIVMQMETPTRAQPPLTGDIDEVKAHILTLLEGGAEAFRRRQEKYEDLLR
jgi:energy-coupling factor transporter ATP-binding protein EcfA2